MILPSSLQIFFSLERVFSRICHFHPLLIFLGPTSIFFMEQNKMRLSLSLYMIPCVLEFRLENRKYDSMRLLSSQYFMFRFLEKFLFISCGVTDTANIEVV